MIRKAGLLPSGRDLPMFRWASPAERTSERGTAATRGLRSRYRPPQQLPWVGPARQTPQCCGQSSEDKASHGPVRSKQSTSSRASAESVVLQPDEEVGQWHGWCNPVPLHEVNSCVGDEPVLVLCLDPLGDDEGSDDVGDLDG